MKAHAANLAVAFCILFAFTVSHTSHLKASRLGWTLPHALFLSPAPTLPLPAACAIREPLRLRGGGDEDGPNPMREQAGLAIGEDDDDFPETEFVLRQGAATNFTIFARFKNYQISIDTNPDEILEEIRGKIIHKVDSTLFLSLSRSCSFSAPPILHPPSSPILLASSTFLLPPLSSSALIRPETDGEWRMAASRSYDDSSRGRWCLFPFRAAHSECAVRADVGHATARQKLRAVLEQERTAPPQCHCPGILRRPVPISSSSFCLPMIPLLPTHASFLSALLSY
eukprot:3160686-Rhodomonas_salina.2